MEAGDSFIAGKYSKKLQQAIYNGFNSYCRFKGVKWIMSMRQVEDELWVWKTEGEALQPANHNVTEFKIQKNIPVAPKVPAVNHDIGQLPNRVKKAKPVSADIPAFVNDMQRGEEKVWVNPYDYSDRLRIEKEMNAMFGPNAVERRQFTSFKRDGKIYFKRTF